MINAEKYKDELLKVINENEQDFIAFDVRDNSIKNCTTMVCKNCKFSRTKAKVLCTQTKLKWLLSEYKEPIKLSKLEHGILEYLLENRQYRFVVRERNDCLYIYKSKPKKEADSWGSLSLSNELGLFNNLFQFVAWEDSEPTSIEDVLGNCEVIDDESSK